MNKILRALAFTALLCVTLLTRAESVGLVLSGGGAKGIAHIGVIKALEDNDIPIDYVTGTSMGSVVGSLYACGMSPEQMLELVTSKSFANWSTGRIDPALTYYFDRKEPTPSMLQVQISLKDSTAVTPEILHGALINPLPMNFAFMDLFTAYTAQCGENFNKLFVPFRCVCSDVYHKHKVVLSSGSLGDAVRASMSFPMVYKPIELDGVLMFDGGIYDNFPVDVMQEDFNPDFIIGVSVSAPDGKPEPNNMFSQLEDMIIQNNDYSVPSKNGIKIQVPVLDFGVLDFGKAQEIYQIGYNTGMSMVDSIKSRVAAREPLADVHRRRAEWRSRTPELEFGSIDVTGIPENQARYIRNLFTENNTRIPFNIPEARDSYYRLISSGKVNDMRPTAKLDSVNGLFHITMPVELKKKWSASVGGWLTSSTNSMLYLNTGYHTLSYNSFDAELSGWLGQSYYAGFLSAKFRPSTDTPSYIEFQANASRRKYYDSDVLFYKGDNPSFVSDTEQYVKLNWAMALGRTHKAELSFGQGWMHYSFFPDGVTEFDGSSRDKANYKLTALRLRVDGSTLNNLMYPSSGRESRVSIWGVHEDASFINRARGEDADMPPSYSSASHWRVMMEMRWRRYFQLFRRVSFGLSGEAFGSFGPLGDDYTATMIHAPEFGPTPSTRYYFNTPFRAYNYFAVGGSPVWSIGSYFQLRGDFYLYCPIREMVRTDNGKAAYGRWFHSPQFLGEVAAVYNFNFASLAVYCNYLTHAPRNFNFGLSFGLLFEAPRFIR